MFTLMSTAPTIPEAAAAATATTATATATAAATATASRHQGRLRAARSPPGGFKGRNATMSPSRGSIYLSIYLSPIGINGIIGNAMISHCGGRGFDSCQCQKTKKSEFGFSLRFGGIRCPLSSIFRQPKGVRHPTRTRCGTYNRYPRACLAPSSMTN